VPLLALTGQELDGIKLEAELSFRRGIKQALSKWRVGVPITLADRESSPSREPPPRGPPQRYASTRSRVCS